MKRYKNIILLTLAILSSNQLFAITPVLRGAGIGRTVVPVPAQGGAGYGLASMERQAILVDLYPGLAVVKSVIILGNGNGKPLAISLGLPKSGSFSHDEISVVRLDSLFDLKISWKGRELPAQNIEADLRANGGYLSLPESYRDSVSQWYVWTLDVPPHSLDTLRLSYAVRTGPAELARGGNVRRSFFLGFLLEQARAWDGSLQETELQISLKGGLLSSQLFGTYPREVFRHDRQGRIYFQISGRNPVRHDDVLIGYESKDKFDYFADYQDNKERYYLSINPKRPDSLKLDKVPSGRFDVYPSREYTVLGVLAACLGLVALLLIYLIRRR